MRIFLIVLFISLFSITNNILAQNYLIRVQDFDSDNYYYINQKGEKQFDKSFHAGTDFSSCGCAVVYEKEQYVFKLIDTSGIIIETETPFMPIINGYISKIYGFSSGVIKIVEDEKIGALNCKGKITVKPIYDELSEFNSNHAIGKIRKDYFVVNKNGSSIPIEYEKVKLVKPYSESLAIIRIGEYFGFIDTLGKIVIEPKFYSVGYFNGGLAWAKTDDGKLGYIDKTGDWIIHPIFLAGKDYDIESDMVIVKTPTGWGYINKKNQFKDFSTVGTRYNFEGGLALKRENDLLGYVNSAGDWVIPPKFTVAHEFVNGFARVEVDNKWGIIDKKGNWVIEPIYKEIYKVVELF